MTVKSSISLTDDQHSFARHLVEAGRFQSVSAVLQQGVELLRKQMETDDMERTALSDLLTRRSAGKFVSGKKMDERLSRLFARKRREHGVRD